MKFATGNQNKLREAAEITGMQFEGVDIDLPEIQAINVSEVIKEKAKIAYQTVREPVLVEDTGVSFDAWNGLPGALIKWFMKSVGNNGLIKMMESETNRKAVATTYLCFYDGEKYHTYSGSIGGKIPTEIRGESGFGWDPIFIPDGSDKSFAEMSPEEKNSLSMRARALQTMKNDLRS